MSTELTTTEQSELEKHELIIEAHKASFITCGAALQAIKEKRLYRKNHKTFEEYVNKRWDFSRQRAYQIIDATETVAKMSTVVDKPEHESQARELSHVEDPQEVWEEAQEETGQRQPTAAEVAKVAAMRAIRLADHQFAEQLESGEVKLSNADLKKLGKLSKPEIVAAVKKIRLGEDWKKPTQPPAETPTASIVLDGMNRAVPERLLESHSVAAEISSAASKFDAIKRLVSELAAEPGGVHIARSELETAIASLKKRLKDSRYYTECPACAGETPSTSCKRCKGAGFIPYSMKGVLNEQEKEWLGA